MTSYINNNENLKTPYTRPGVLTNLPSYEKKYIKIFVVASAHFIFFKFNILFYTQHMHK